MRQLITIAVIGVLFAALIAGGALRATREGSSIAVVVIFLALLMATAMVVFTHRRALNMLRGKELQNPWKKHDNIPL